MIEGPSLFSPLSSPNNTSCLAPSAGKVQVKPTTENLPHSFPLPARTVDGHNKATIASLATDGSAEGCKAGERKMVQGKGGKSDGDDCNDSSGAKKQLRMWQRSASEVSGAHSYK